MKTKYKYLILILATVLASIFIYYYIEDNTKVEMDPDILVIQNDIENEILSDTDYSIDNPKVILNPYEISPLTALVVFKTNDLASAIVTVKGKDDDEDIVNTFVPSKEHLLTIYGLYPNYENKVIINCSDEEKVLTIKTGSLPKNINSATTYESNSDDFYFTTSINGYPIAYDKNGNVRWYLTKNFGWDFTRLSNGYVLLGNSYLMKDPYYSSGLVEMDLLGKVYYEYNIPFGYHHDVYEKTNGNLIALSNDSSFISKEDLIVEIDRNNGSIIKSFDLSKLLKNKLDDYIGLDSVAYNANSNSILAASKNNDMIVNIDYGTGEFNWIIADKDKVSNDMQKYLLSGSNEIEFPIKPQAITLIDGNKFAYINSKDKENHLIIYEVNLNSKTFEESDNYNLGTSSENANIDYKDGKFIIVQDKTIKSLENDELTTIMMVNNSLYSAKATKMYAGDMYVTGKGARIGSTGITPTVQDHNVIFHKKDDSIFDKYNLELKVDANRFTVKGTFDKNDKVQVILDNVLSKKTYDVDMTSGTLDNGKVSVSTYISKQGIYGKYYVYLKINGVNYKLGKYVLMS